MSEAVESYQDFYASHDHMPGSLGALRVTGTVVFRTSGWSCRVEETQGNTGINPNLLHLDLVFEATSSGGAVTEVLTQCPFEWVDENPTRHYEEVHFHVVGTTDDPPPRLVIDHPE